MIFVWIALSTVFVFPALLILAACVASGRQSRFEEEHIFVPASQPEEVQNAPATSYQPA